MLKFDHAVRRELHAHWFRHATVFLFLRSDDELQNKLRVYGFFFFPFFFLSLERDSII